MDERYVVVAGHLCLDLIPTIGANVTGLESLLTPGKLVDVGPIVMSTGGTVSNTGLALHRLGVRTLLMGKVGDDLLGRAILDIVRREDPRLADGMILAPNEATSYTVVINPPGVDRVFLHCPGTNDTFDSNDVAYDKLEQARLFHFGYPPLMRKMYSDGGKELSAMLERAKKTGVTTSLDMARPDPDSDAGRADWRAILERALPFVDVFLPSLDETLFMLDRARFDSLEQTGEMATHVDAECLAELSSALLEMGAGIIAFKMGDQGLYLRTTADEHALSDMGGCAPRDVARWKNRELLAPCFKTEVVGTTGAGDCTIAGFLAALANGLPAEDAMTSAVAVGACNVEKADATSGIPSWDDVRRRIRNRPERLPLALSLDGWRWDGDAAIWRGPADSPNGP